MEGHVPFIFIIYTYTAENFEDQCSRSMVQHHVSLDTYYHKLWGLLSKVNAYATYL